MARPTAAAVPPAPPLLVDTRTPFVAATPPLRLPNGTPVTDHMVMLAICAGTAYAPIHGTLAGLARHVGDGVYKREFQARDLAYHLARFAGQRVCVVPWCPGLALAAIPHTVMVAPTADRR